MSTEDVKQRLSQALSEGKSITIHVHGDSGKVRIEITHDIVATYRDAYEAMRALIPAHYKEFMEGVKDG